MGLALAAAVAAVRVPSPRRRRTSDADAAISQAWDAGGGDTGPLGPKDGDVYPIGAGFGQNFAGGKIFFTPDTGAHIMLGAILDKYLSLGGPADGDLGFPTIDEGDGKAPGSRNTTFSAADNPVIFFTPDTGAHVVRGAINAAWDKLGGSAGVLGVPTDDEVYRGDVTSARPSPVASCRGTEGQGVHDDPARVGRPACRPGDSGRRDDCDRRRAPGRRRSTRAPGCRRRDRRQDRLAMAWADLRGRQDLLQPGHRRQRDDRPGPGQVRERRRPRGRPRASPPATRPTAGLAPMSRIGPSPPRTSRSSSGRPTSAPSSCAAR